MKVNALLLGSFLAFLTAASVSGAEKTDAQKENQTLADKAQFKTINWTERREWVESIKPIDYWAKRNKIGYIEMSNGIPTIMVDGKPMPPLTSYVGYIHDFPYYKKVDRKYHDDMTDAMTKGEINYQALSVCIYLKSNTVVWSRARSAAAEFMKKNPNTRFFLRLNFFVDREWFSSTYPGNMTMFEDGTEEHWSPAGLKKERYSYASNIWERHASEGLLKMLEELKKEPYADKVFGVKVTFGVTGEGGWWSEFPWDKHGIDYSPAMQDYFKEYLKRKYNNNEKLLQSKWGQQTVTFDNAKIPSMEARGIDSATSCNEGVFKFPGAFGYFRDPQAGGTMQVIDFHMAMSNVLQERLSYFCEVIKRASDGKLLTGGLHSPPYAATGYHWAGPGGFGALLESPYVDFDSTPWTYEGRDLGEGLTFRGPIDTMALHKKSLWVECDTRTSTINKPERGNERCYGAPLNIEGDRENLRRDFIRLITSRANGYWYEITFPWFTLPEQREIIADIGILSGKLEKLDRKRNSEIAIIYDWNSSFYTTEFVDFVSLCRQLLQEFVYIGADFDMYTTDDIGNPEVDNHKLFIFPNAINMSKDKRDRIEKNLKKDGKVLLWSYAPGLINPDAKVQLSVDHSSELTGMKLEYNMKKLSPLMKAITSNDPMAKRLPAGYQFGAQPRPVHTGPGYAIPEKPFIPAPINVFPQFYVNDTAAVKLGAYVDTQKTGYAIKRMKDWTSIYAGTYFMSSDVLRAAAKEAGVHLYLDKDNVVYHNRCLLGIHTKTEGKKIIRLPKKCDVYDLFENKLIGKNIDQFEGKSEAGKTSLYFTGDLSELQKTGLAEQTK